MSKIVVSGENMSKFEEEKKFVKKQLLFSNFFSSDFFSSKCIQKKCCLFLSDFEVDLGRIPLRKNIEEKANIFQGL